MNDDIKDLLLISLEAQYSYVLDRLHGKKRIKNMITDIEFFIHLIETDPDFNEHLEELAETEYTETGKMCLTIYLEVYKNISDRFVYGWTKDICLEKL